MITPVTSWKSEIKERFEEIIFLMKQENKLIAKTQEVVDLDDCVKKLDNLVQKIFYFSPKKDGFIQKNNPLSRPLFWKAETQQVFAIPEEPYPSITAIGGWKTSKVAILFDGRVKKAKLVWVVWDSIRFTKDHEILDRKYFRKDFDQPFMEAKLTSRFGDKPYWPKVYLFHRIKLKMDFGSFEMRYLFSERYVHNLATARKKYGFSPLDTLMIIAQVAEALAFLHDLNLIHGDLKPGNILLSDTVTLCDYDFTFDQSVEKPTFAIYGQPEYAAPELVQDYLEVKDFKPAESYALGMSMYTYREIMSSTLWGKPLYKYFTTKYQRSLAHKKSAEEYKEETLKKQRQFKEKSDVCIQQLEESICSIETLVINIRGALTHPDPEKRAKLDYVLAITKKYRSQFPKSLIESISKNPKS